ncbi:MAG: ACP S-malonyltransferase [Desulfobacterales bacterium]|nr:ACP S-malonyltransferase [Desulfobacterales bacterium]
MKDTVFLFPGQGSQSVGMGAEFYKEYDVVREIFDMAEETCRINLSRLCFKGPMEELTTTMNLQPAITAVNLSCLAVLEKEGIPSPMASAGHSLGEFSALRAAGVVTAEDALKLVFRRGQLMHRESQRYEGAMYAILNLALDPLEEVVEEAREEGIVSIANHNSELQIVITGSPGPAGEAARLATQRGAKAIPLKVSGAWHSELMEGAVEDFREFLQTIPFAAPRLPVIHNVSAESAPGPEEIREMMARQLCSRVRWCDTIKKISEEGGATFVELGPGRVLAGLTRRILPRDAINGPHNVFDMKTLEKFLKATS